MKRVIIAALFLGISMTTYLLSFVACTPPPKPPKLVISPLELNLKYEKSSLDSKDITVSDYLYISNSGDGELTWHVNWDADWLNLHPKDGICASENGTVTASAKPALLSEGNYSTVCKFFDVNNPVNFQSAVVNFVIKPQPTKTYVDPLNRFSFSYPSDGLLNHRDRKLTDDPTTSVEYVMINTFIRAFITLYIWQYTNPIADYSVEDFIGISYNQLKKQAFIVTEIETIKDYGIWNGYAAWFITNDESPTASTKWEYEQAYFKIFPNTLYVLRISCSNLRKDQYISDEYQKHLKRIANSFVFK